MEATLNETPRVQTPAQSQGQARTAEVRSNLLPTTLPAAKEEKSYGHPEGRRSPKELIAAGREYQKENRARTWFHVFETFGVWALLQAVTIVSTNAWIRGAAAIVLGLTIVRAFILYHDFMHNAILRNSKVGKWIMYVYGIYVLTPPNVWRQTHNYHHAHTAKIAGSHVGSYAMVSLDIWKQMDAKQRWMYKAVRHPLNIFFAYFTVFMLGMCVSSFQRDKKKNWDSLLAVIANLVLSAAIIYFAGFAMWFFAMFVPLFVATMSGAYLFYAQHNFPEINVQGRSDWEYTRAAIESSSYMKLNPIMNWFTGNIGYHHVHHLNPGIPFYRLPEAMEGIPELHHPLGTTSLSPRDIILCFRQKLWDAEQGKMVGYPAE